MRMVCQHGVTVVQETIMLRMILLQPYVAGQLKANDKLSIDVSMRFDSGKARGTYAGATQSTNLDVDNNGTIQGPEASVSVVDNANRKPINYDFKYVSYSFWCKLFII